MKFNNFRLAQAACLAFALMLSLVPVAPAQEGEVRVIDEVIAEVNADVVTLSMVKREMKEVIAMLKQQGKTEEQATEEVARRRPELIAGLINEQLLLQQGKDSGLVRDVEDEVNRRMLGVAKEQGIKTIEELKKAMRESNYDYDEVRQTMRAEMMKQAVLSREVDAKIFYGLSTKELNDYFNAHKDQFKKPESVKLSEIFLSLAGKSEAEVKAKAAQIVAEARGGADFGKLAATHSERMQNGKPVALETKGDVGMYDVPNLKEAIANAIKNVKAGGVSDPIRYDEGYQIIRVDERNPGADTPTFNENRVREVITAERTDKERIAYMEKLRKDAYIKVAEAYRAEVMPLLTTGPAPATSTNAKPSASPAASAGKRSDRSNGGKP
ncbi:MAG: peptidyl-prolyl cis-trans isomerase [Pyrinomonadaceae bacterium]|nr:peptidyl-prolyl cis-trans isomerase [Pyrinomonadaceae bacterium]